MTTAHLMIMDRVLIMSRVIIITCDDHHREVGQAWPPLTSTMPWSASSS